ncbi:MAG TPA: dynamin family protein [Ktedonobacteraceae bacterium]
MAMATGSVLQEQQRVLLQQERRLVNKLQTRLVQFAEIDPAHVVTLSQVMSALDELFLLVIVGEFNAGKSATINALLRAPVLKEGVTPTTQAITLLRYGDQVQQQTDAQGMKEVRYPADFLRDITIVDTPGVNAVLREHEKITEEFIPRSDLVLFIASADRPFTESERAFLERMRMWGKKVVIVVNKVDLLRSPEEVREVLDFVRGKCKELLGFEPGIFPISAQQARQAQRVQEQQRESGEESSELWKQSGFHSFEHFLFETLDETERVRLKLSTPLGVMQRLLGETRKVVEQRASLLEEDARTIGTIGQQQQLYREDMERNFTHRLSEIENIILEMRERGDRFFDDTIRFGRIFDLLHPERIKGEFQEKVIGDSEKRIDNTVQQLIDWMVEQEQRFWQDIMEYLDRRREVSARRENEMIGSVNRRFDHSRRALLQEVARTADTIFSTYDRDVEAAELSHDLRASVVQAGLVSAGGIGLGAAVVAATTIAALDITGVLTGILLLGVGFYIIPARRSRAKREFNYKMDELRARLHQAMKEQFHKELKSSTARVQDAIAPYTRFVRAEQERTGAALASISSMENEIHALGQAVARIGG